MIPSEKLNLVYNEIEKINIQIKLEDAKGLNANVDKIISLARKISFFLNANEGFLNNVTIRRIRTDLDNIVVELQDTYNNKKVKYQQWASGTLSLIGGVAAMGQVAQYAIALCLKIDPSLINLDSLGPISQGLSGAANGISQFSQAATNEQEGKRTGLHNRSETLKKCMEELNQMLASARARKDEHYRGIGQAIENYNRAFNNAASKP